MLVVGGSFFAHRDIRLRTLIPPFNIIKEGIGCSGTTLASRWNSCFSHIKTIAVLVPKRYKWCGITRNHSESPRNHPGIEGGTTLKISPISPWRVLLKSLKSSSSSSSAAAAPWGEQFAFGVHGPCVHLTCFISY